MPGDGMRVDIMGSCKQFRSRLYETFSHCLCFSPWILVFLGWLSFFLEYPSKIAFPWHGKISHPVPGDTIYFMSSAVILGTHILLPSVNLCLWPLSQTTDVNFHLLPCVSSTHLKYGQNQSLILELFAPFVFFISFNDCHLSFGYQKEVLN